jgi:MFS family permease
VFVNVILVNGLLMATEPLLSVLMLARLGFAPWQFALAFALPCVGGLLGARLAPRLSARFGRHRAMRASGALRAIWPVGLAFMGRGLPGMLLVIALQLCLVTCIGVFNPLMATYRLEQTATDRVARMLSAWTISSSATIAALTAVWGGLAAFAGPRVAIGIAGGLLLATPLLLHRPRAKRLRAGRPLAPPPGIKTADR